MKAVSVEAFALLAEPIGVVATQATAWHTTSVAPGLPISRLAVERDATGVDVLYLVDFTNNHLYYGRN